MCGEDNSSPQAARSAIGISKCKLSGSVRTRTSETDGKLKSRLVESGPRSPVRFFLVRIFLIGDYVRCPIQSRFGHLARIDSTKI